LYLFWEAGNKVIEDADFKNYADFADFFENWFVEVD